MSIYRLWSILSWEWGVGSGEMNEQAAGGKRENEKLALSPLCSLLPAPLPLPHAQYPIPLITLLSFTLYLFGFSEI
jgi:hypothetical protein